MAGALGWFNYPIRQVIRDIFRRPLALINDARSATVGEWKRGAGRHYKTFICITIGRGIGSGLVLDNKLWEGSHGIAGEVGHGGDMQDRIVCDCGKLSRCTEGLSSSRGIEWLFHQTASRQANSKIAQFQKQLGRPARLKDLAPLIRAHDPEIMATLKSALTPLANRLCLLLFLLDLETVLVGGGSSALGDDLIKPLAAMVRERMWEKYSETVAFKVCELHNDAGITGAVEWALMHYQPAG